MAKNWTDLVAARAMGQPIDPEDMDAARAAARRPAPTWADRVAERATQQRQPEQGDTFRAAILRRIGRTDAQDEGAPPPAA